jgi:hypothetical protein
LKKLVASILLACFVCVEVPGAAAAESVFAAALGTQAPPRLELATPPSLGVAGNGLLGEPGMTAGIVAGTPSPLSAAGSSLLLPGLGQYRLGHTLSAKVYFGLEGLCWLAIGSTLWAGHSRADSYRDYAIVFAGVEGTDHPDSYYDNLGRFQTSDGPGGFNESVRRDARDLFYPDAAAMDAYYDAHKVAPSDGWTWRSAGDFHRYAALRDGSKYAYRVALYTAVFAGALRIVSAADAVRLARKAPPAEQVGKVSFGLDAGPQGPSLYVQTSF